MQIFYTVSDSLVNTLSNVNSVVDTNVFGDTFTIALSIITSLCLSTGCGLRVFTPFFILSLITYFFPEAIHLSEDVAFMSSLPAVILLGIAACLEVLAFYIPWLDNVLGAITIPIAGVSGVALGAMVLADLPPAVQWGLAILGGGGATGIQLTTESIRAVSTAVTAGFGNFIVATIENVAALILSILAIISPIIALFFLAIFLLLIFTIGKKFIEKRKKKKQLAS